MGDGAWAAEARVTGLFGDLEQARGVPCRIARHRTAFIAETKVHTAAAEEIPSILELDAGQVLLLVDAADQASLALEIINRNQGITGGVRMPT